MIDGQLPLNTYRLEDPHKIMRANHDYPRLSLHACKSQVGNISQTHLAN